MPPTIGGRNMATYISGNGGSITLDASPDVVLALTQYSLTQGNRLADVSTSAQASSLFIGTLLDHQWTCELPLDTDNKPETGGFVPGANVSLSFKVGSASLYHQLVNSCIENVATTVNSAGDAVRLSISGRGGVLTRYANAVIS